MATFTLGGQTFAIERLRLGEIKAIARLNEEAIPDGGDAMLQRYAKIVEIGTARFGERRFVASDDAECSVFEITKAAAVIFGLAGFVSSSGEAPAAAE